MKTKIKITVLVLMAMFCIAPNTVLTANAETKTIAVHANIWTIHGIYTKTTTSKQVYAKNYSGYGEYAYCYGQSRSNISGEWVAYTSNYKLNKDNSQVTMNLSNTIDKGKSISLRLIGADTQTGDDSNRVYFSY